MFVATRKEAEALAQRAIDDWRDGCDPEWPEEVDDVCFGNVIGFANRVDGPTVDYVETCDFKLAIVDPIDCKQFSSAALESLPPQMVQFGVRLVLPNGVVVDSAMRWQEWKDAAEFAEHEVHKKRAVGFWMFKEAAV